MHLYTDYVYAYAYTYRVYTNIYVKNYNCMENAYDAMQKEKIRGFPGLPWWRSG